MLIFYGGIKMKKTLLASLVVVVSTLCSVGSQVYAASESQQTPMERSSSASSTSKEYRLSTQNQERLDNILANHPGYSDYFSDIQRNITESGLVSPDQYNKEIAESISGIEKALADNQIKKQEINERIKGKNLPNELNSKKERGIGSYAAAKAAWLAGAATVNGMGYPNTSAYMVHAAGSVIPFDTPPDHVSNQNAWAKTIIANNDILNTHHSEYEIWIWTDDPVLTVSKSFEFTSGDPYYALHNVNYTYTYVRQPNGSVKCSGTVTDVYDFALTDYDSLMTGFANNVGVFCQQFGVIAPYDIIIKYSWG